MYVFYVIIDNDGKRIIMDEVHEGLGDNLTTKAFAAHYGHNQFTKNLLKNFTDITWLRGVYIKNCQNCQQKGRIFIAVFIGLLKDWSRIAKHATELMKQIGVGLCDLHEVDVLQFWFVLTTFQSGLKLLKIMFWAFYTQSFAEIDPSKYKKMIEAKNL